MSSSPIFRKLLNLITSDMWLYGCLDRRESAGGVRSGPVSCCIRCQCHSAPGSWRLLSIKYPVCPASARPGPDIPDTAHCLNTPPPHATFSTCVHLPQSVSSVYCWEKMLPAQWLTNILLIFIIVKRKLL